MSKTVNKYYRILIIFYILFLAACMGNTVKVLNAQKFSINIPNGWAAEKESEDKALLIMPEAKSEEITISIVASPTHGDIPLDEVWNKIKPFMVNNKNIIVDEGRDYFSNTTWKKLVIKQVICGVEMNKIVLFTQRNSTNYLVQFDCPKDKFDEILSLFSLTMQSFKFRNDK